MAIPSVVEAFSPGVATMVGVGPPPSPASTVPADRSEQLDLQEVRSRLFEAPVCQPHPLTPGFPDAMVAGVGVSMGVIVDDTPEAPDVDLDEGLLLTCVHSPTGVEDVEEGKGVLHVEASVLKTQPFDQDGKGVHVLVYPW